MKRAGGADYIIENTPQPAWGARVALGARRTQEDALCATKLLLPFCEQQLWPHAGPSPLGARWREEPAPAWLFAVFDGHGGSEVAHHASKRLAPMLQAALMLAPGSGGTHGRGNAHALEPRTGAVAHVGALNAPSCSAQPVDSCSSDACSATTAADAALADAMLQAGAAASAGAAAPHRWPPGSDDDSCWSSEATSGCALLTFGADGMLTSGGCLTGGGDSGSASGGGLFPGGGAWPPAAPRLLSGAPSLQRPLRGGSGTVVVSSGGARAKSGGGTGRGSDSCSEFAGDKQHAAICSALTQAFLQTDQELAGSEVGEVVGSTAAVTLVASTHMYIAHCGDSRVVLCRRGTAVQLTQDHKPDREDERARIAALGGRVVTKAGGSRVAGLLGMTRALGDHLLRPYVIPEPEVSVVPRCDDDQLLIIASDGLWDVFSCQEACTLALRSALRARERGASAAAACRVGASVLARGAAERGSKDNVSVLLIDLRRTETAGSVAAVLASWCSSHCLGSAGPLLQQQEECSIAAALLPRRKRSSSSGGGGNRQDCSGDSGSTKAPSSGSLSLDGERRQPVLQAHATSAPLLGNSHSVSGDNSQRQQRLPSALPPPQHQQQVRALATAAAPPQQQQLQQPPSRTMSQVEALAATWAAAAATLGRSSSSAAVDAPQRLIISDANHSSSSSISTTTTTSTAAAIGRSVSAACITAGQQSAESGRGGGGGASPGSSSGTSTPRAGRPSAGGPRAPAGVATSGSRGTTSRFTLVSSSPVTPPVTQQLPPTHRRSNSAGGALMSTGVVPVAPVPPPAAAASAAPAAAGAAAGGSGSDPPPPSSVAAAAAITLLH